MRKKIVAVFVTLAAFLALGPGISSGEGRRLSLGVNAGGGPVGASWPAWRAGLEVGLRLGTSWVVSAEAAYGSLSLENTSSLGSYSAREVQTWTVLPAGLAVRREAVLSDRAAAWLGAGLSYQTFSRKIETESSAPGGTSPSSTKSSFAAWAPQAELGLEFILGKAVSLTGRMRYEFGVASQTSTVSGLAAAQDFGFGGASLAVGLRIHLW
jgi:opacity protein-like surface antigen